MSIVHACLIRIPMLLLALFAAAALAQTPGEIVVQGRPLAQPAGDAAYDIVEIDRERIAATASNRIEDVLRDVAGLTQFRRSDARSANATSQGATLRGLGGNASSRALVLLDGVPQSDPFGGWITWPAFAPERIGLVRVTRGGGSGAFGSGALAGTIELESISEGTGLQAEAAYGSRDAVEGSTLLSGRLGGGFAFIGANYARGDGFVPIVKRQRGPVDRASPYEQASAAARAVIPAGANSELQASILAFTDRRERGTILSQNGGDGADASLRLVHRGKWGAQALAYLQLREFRSRFVSIDAARAAVAQTVDQYNVPSTGLGARIELRPPVGDRVELRLGGDFRRTTGETNEIFTYVAGLPTRIREAGGENDVAGAYAEVSANIGTFRLTGGARIDRWWIRDGRLRERTIATGASLRDEIAPDRQGWEPTARGGLAWTQGGVTLRAAGYLGWRLPTLNELYRPFRVGADATAANPALSPERMRGAELGLRWVLRKEGDLYIDETGIGSYAPSPGTTLTFDATLFTNRLTRPIANVTLASGPGTFPGVGFVAAGGAFRQRQNLDAIRSNGVEFDVKLTSGEWRLGASYAYTDARVRASGLALPLDGLRPAQVPAHTASVTLGWRGLSTTARYVSGQYEDDLNQRRLDDAVTFDAVADVRVNDHLSLRLRGENLADTRVEAAITGAGVVERATPRTLWVGVRYRDRP